MATKQHRFSTQLAPTLNRRRFVTGVLGSSVLMGIKPDQALAQYRPASQPELLAGSNFDLDIAYTPVNFTGREKLATTVNGSLPAPILRWREGETVTLRVHNSLAEDSSIHWHGIILPSAMDGVPGLSFNGIRPGETFEYRFQVRQNGTFWYHSHSAFQEQTGLYGALIIDPAEPDPFSYDRDYVVMLSDWSDTAPAGVYSNLKKMSHYYNFNQRTLADIFNEVRDKGAGQAWNDRVMWNRMRMTDRDIADVTGSTYTYLMNGVTPDPGWLGMFSRGERVRLRFINSSAMTFFDVRIPGLTMTVIAADGQNVEPVSVDEFRIGVAETYDVIVEPEADTAYSVFAQSIDRSGYALGALTPDISLQPQIPAMDPAPVLTMRDMGMDMQNMEGMDMDHSMHSMAGFGSNAPISHVSSEFGPGVDMRSESPQSGLNDPGIGLRDHQRLFGRRVLTYADLINLNGTLDPREPEREVQLHLTGNMHRYMWSFNGIPFADAEPLALSFGERVRITLVNDTMMTHPIHLHGLWSELETGAPDRIPRKHTVIVQPGSKISYLVTADARGSWAYHCHLLYHMMGMFREVVVS